MTHQPSTEKKTESQLCLCEKVAAQEKEIIEAALRFVQTGDGECLDHESTMVWFIEERRHRFGGFGIATEAVHVVGKRNVS
ncbi:MAG: hypothetical protein WAN14_15285 [Candidatus Acidiferrales bacterium]